MTGCGCHDPAVFGHNPEWHDRVRALFMSPSARAVLEAERAWQAAIDERDQSVSAEGKRTASQRVADAFMRYKNALHNNRQDYS